MTCLCVANLKMKYFIVKQDTSNIKILLTKRHLPETDPHEHSNTRIWLFPNIIYFNSPYLAYIVFGESIPADPLFQPSTGGYNSMGLASVMP